MTIANEFIEQNNGWKSQSETYHRLRGLIAAQDSKMSDFVTTINSDPSLVTKVVDFANSPLFNPVRSIQTLEQAISHLGVMQLKDVLLCNLTINAFTYLPDNIIKLPIFWENSLLCAIIARILAQKCNLQNSGQLFTLGLLHDIGHLAMYSVIPDTTLEAFNFSNQRDKPVNIVEREKLGFDYAQVGSELMQNWSFPLSYQIITEHHPEPKDTPEFYLETAIIHMARCLTFQTEKTSKNKQFQIKPIASSVTNLSIDSLTDLKEQAQHYVTEIAHCLELPLPDSNISTLK